MIRSLRTPIQSVALLFVVRLMLVEVEGGEDLELKHSDDDLRVRGVFDANLPNTEKKYSLKVILHPHFGDLHRKDHLRVPIGLRYGMSEKWEISAEVETYFPHGLGNDTGDSTFGISGYSIGTKLHRGFFPNYNWDQVVGANFFTPASTPPSDVTDGLWHFRPYMNFARYLDHAPRSRVFWGLGLDVAGDSGFEGTFLENAIGDSANTFSAGRVWEGDTLTYTFEATYATSRLIGSNSRDLVTIRPGVIWRVPRSYTFNSRGNWILGTGVKVAHGHEGMDYGISLKLKLNFNFKD
ncbi:hypothetical protein VDG1235_2717 [Verrucomicrobiia bacterium DG1235]|nr:hypothetical protein VDG1235_2717 [Verrucomicrobiae bacterium DG1235]